MKYAIQYRRRNQGNAHWKLKSFSINSLPCVRQQAKEFQIEWPKYEWRICKVVETLEEIEVIK